MRRGENYERGEALLIIFSVGLCEHDRMRPCDYCKMCYVLRDRTPTKCDVFSSSESVAKCSKVHLVTALRIQSQNTLAPIVSRSVSVEACSSPNKAHLYGAGPCLYTLCRTAVSPAVDCCRLLVGGLMRYSAWEHAQTGSHYITH